MWRVRKSIRRKVILVFSVVAMQVLMFLFCQVTVNRVTANKYEKLIEEKDTRLMSAERMACVTRREVRAGELLTEENTEKKVILSEQNPEVLIEDVIGMTVCADLQEGEIITTSLCREQSVAPSERKCVFDNIEFTECFADYASVDVRIRYANGENYCVLKKKRLQKTEEEKEVCCFSLTEEEQLLMSAAQYDEEMYEGTKLYLVGFMEERLQEDSVSDYLPAVQVIMQLHEWDEVYEIKCKMRSELEKRLLEHRKQRMDGLL